MVRHFCDHCGIRVFEPERLIIKDGMTLDKYDICEPCLKKLYEWLNENERKEENIKIKITDVTEEAIVFTDGSKIEYEHEQDCCEHNYADFNQLDDIGRVATFVTPLKFEKVEHGFRFGNPNNMFFIPCYSEQNGYYSDSVDIIYNGVKVFTVQAEEVS